MHLCDAAKLINIVGSLGLFEPGRIKSHFYFILILLNRHNNGENQSQHSGFTELESILRDVVATL